MNRVITGAKSTLAVVVAGAVAGLIVDAGGHLGEPSSSALGALVERAGSGHSTCSGEMAAVPTEDGTLCVDRFEASAAPSCPNAVPEGPRETAINLGAPNCTAVSQRGQVPWRFVSREQAARLCARAGKRLPTPREWYQAALALAGSGTSSERCVLDADAPVPAGSHASCVTSQGIYDLVGNVWEWTSATVRGHTYEGRQLASSTGYVAAADSAGLPLATVSSEPPVQYGRDYAWLSGATMSGLLRGGFFASGADGGIYAVHTGKAPTYRGQGVGFRCVK
jgi:hypothetical protein